MPVFDPISQKIIDQQPRELIHQCGLWHKSVQAHLIRENTQGQLEIFVQERSEYVDISCCKLDQSLATQMIIQDDNNSEQALARGLWEELRIIKYRSCYLPLKLWIIKEYAQHPGILNREMLSLFIVSSYQQPNISYCKKIKNGYWMLWSKFVKLVINNNHSFTKTAQMYMLNPQIVNCIKEYSWAHIRRMNLPISKVFSIHHLAQFDNMGKHRFNQYISLKALRSQIQL